MPVSAVGKTIEVWFQDEARVGQKGSIEYIWAPIGSRPPMVRDNRHSSRSYLRRDLPVPRHRRRRHHAGRQHRGDDEHLKEISSQVAPDAQALLVCDGAGWHQPGELLIVPDNITLMKLPPYAPELNPMENIWDYLRGNKLSSLVCDQYDAILNACVEAWNFIANDPDRIASIGTRSWAGVKG